jgi:fatty acid desaturase
VEIHLKKEESCEASYGKLKQSYGDTGLETRRYPVGVHGGKSFFKEETKMRKIKWVIIQYIFVVFSLGLLIRLGYFADKLRRQGIDDIPVVLFWVLYFIFFFYILSRIAKKTNE